MTLDDNRQLPAALAAALATDFDYDGGNGVDFEPYATFLSAADTTDWWQSWTGNAELRGDDFRVFGQDGTGGYAAIWLVRAALPLTDQPIVFLGSEGETAVLAHDLDDFLWLLAAGFGPYEATEYGPEWAPAPNPHLVAVAERFAPDRRQPGAAVIERAVAEYPDFGDRIMGLCH
ncbi:hypothetical protein AB0H76_17685 [Nocardia sp. NPDC050712]|uniref:hypothetical protein n=1 Tax=Nocardia sp. NPDC050712 TaxID=3155518 RepID=UPI0033C33D4F